MAAILEKANDVSAASRILAACGVAAAGAGAAGVWYFDPSKSNFFPVCPLFKLTGFACPGCGMTRGFHALLNGDLMTALDFNAFIPVFGLFAAYLLTSTFLFAFRGRGLSIGNRFAPPILWTTLGLLVVFGVVRNIPVYPFTALLP